RDEALALYDERFCRMWEFYLACCEAAFRYQNVAVFQLQCTRSAYAVPLTRNYIAERYEDLRMREAEIARAATVRPEIVRAPEETAAPVRAEADGRQGRSTDPVPLRKQQH